MHLHPIPHVHIDCSLGEVPKSLRLEDVHDLIIKDEDPVDRGLRIVLLVDSKNVVLFFLQSENPVLGAIENPRNISFNFNMTLGVDRRKFEESCIKEWILAIPSEGMHTRELECWLNVLFWKWSYNRQVLLPHEDLIAFSHSQNYVWKIPLLSFI